MPTTAPAPTTRHRRWQLLLPPLLLAGLAPQPAGAQSWLEEKLKKAREALEQAQSQQQQQQQQLQQQQQPQQPPAAARTNSAAQTAAAAAAVNAAAHSAPLLASTRDASGMQALFAKGTVTGVDLMLEMKAIRGLFGNRRGGARADLSSLLSGTAQDNPGAAGAGVLGGLFQGGAEGVMLKGAMAIFESAMANAISSSTSTSGLGEFLDTLMGDSQRLEAQTVTLPSDKKLTPPQMQRAVNLAAIVVLTRLTARVIEQAQKDLTELDQGYAALVERREKAATLLQQALVSGLPDSARNTFSPAELDYLRGFSAENFVKDMDAQRLALRLVAATDPAAASDYKLQSDGLVKRTTIPLRAMGGVAAFGGLLAWSGRELSKLGKDQPISELLAFGPLIFAFVKEVPPIVQNIAKLTVDGVPELAGMVSGKNSGFRVTVDGKTEEVRSAATVFETLEKHGVMPELRNALFRNDARGLLFAVNQCDSTTTAQMLDLATTPEQRSTFARETRQPNPGEFSFVEAFAAGGKGQAELAHTLLKSDYRPRLDRDIAMATVQIGVAGTEQHPADAAKPGFLRWNNDQLLRMIFVNRDGRAQHSTLEIGKVQVRPVPSMASIYAYETLANACRQQFTPAAEPKAQPAGSATPPGQKQRPVKKT